MKSLKSQMLGRGVPVEKLDSQARKEVLPDSIFDSSQEGGGAWFVRAFGRIPLP